MLRSTFIIFTLVVELAVSAPNGCTELCTTYHHRHQGGSNNGPVENNLDATRVGQSSSSSSSSSSSYHRESAHRGTSFDDNGSSLMRAGSQQSRDSSLNADGNWHRADSWKTDDGHGQVAEEEGQIVNGPTKIKYYRKNYTSSSYDSGDLRNVQSALPNIQSEFQRIQKQFDRYGHEIHRSGAAAGSLTRDTAIVDEIGNTGYVENSYNGGGSVQRPTSTNYEQTSGQRERYEIRGESTGMSLTDSHLDNRPNDGITYQRLYVVPSSRGIPPVLTKTSETHRVYEEIRAPHHQERQIIHRVPINTDDATIIINDNSNRLLASETSHAEIQRIAEESRLDRLERQRQVFNQSPPQQNHAVGYGANENVETFNVLEKTVAPVRRYEQHWSESSHTSEIGVPRVTAGHVIQDQRSGYSDLGRSNDRQRSWSSSHETRENHRSGGLDGYVDGRQREKMVVGAVDLGHGIPDCYGTINEQQRSNVPSNRYKREAGFDDDTQRTQDFTQQAQDFTQQTQDYSQSSSDFGDFTDQRQAENLDSQRPISGKLEFGQTEQQQNGKMELDPETRTDLTQRTGKIQFFPYYKDLDDLTQRLSQHPGHLEFDNHHSQHSRHSVFDHQNHEKTESKIEFSQNTRRIQDSTQRTTGHFQNPWKLESDQDGDFQSPTADGRVILRQTIFERHRYPGKLEFGKPTEHDRDAITQERASGFGKLEIGQHTQGNQDPSGDLKKLELDRETQRQDFGELEFGQKNQDDVTRQTGNLGSKLEPGQYDRSDLTQQLTTGGLGKIEFGQPNEPLATVPDPTQQRRTSDSGKLDLSQRDTQREEDLPMQQRSSGLGELEFGRSSQDPTQQLTGSLEKLEPSQHDRHLTQQQQQQQRTSGLGKLEFGQLNRDDQDLTQQQTGSLEKLELSQHDQQDQYLTQQQQQQQQEQTSDFGKLEFGQNTQRENSGKLEFDQLNQDLTQQRASHLGKLEFGQNTQWDLTQRERTSGSGKLDFSQRDTQRDQDFLTRTSDLGKLEFGQLNQENQVLTNRETDQQDQYLTGKLEFGRYTQRDLTQQPQTRGSGKLDFSQRDAQEDQDLLTRTSELGKLEFGQSNRENQDLTQQQRQTGSFEKLETSQHDQRVLAEELLSTGGWVKPEFNQDTQQEQELTQQRTSDFKILDQNTQWGTNDFGKLEFGRYEQQQQQQRHNGDLDKLEFSQNTQQDPMQSRNSGFGKLEFGRNIERDVTQGRTTGDFENIEFGRNAQHDQGTTRRSGDLGNHRRENAGYFNEKSSGKLAIVEENKGQIENLQHGRTTQVFLGEDQRADDLKIEEKMESQTPRREIATSQWSSGKFEMVDKNHRQIDEQSGGNDQRTEDDSLGWKYVPRQRETTPIFDAPTTAKPYRPIYAGVKGRRKIKPRTTEAPIISNGQAGDTNIPSINGSPFDAQPELELENHSRSTYNGGRSENNGQRTETSLDTTNPSIRWHLDHSPGDLTNGENYPRKSRVYGENTRENEMKFQPRILEVYGGTGSYDSRHGDDIFTNVEPNRSATLSTDGSDPWEIREKPLHPVEPTESKFPIRQSTTRESTTEIPPEVPTTAPSTSFWSRVGQKFGNAYERAKEKATGIFGK